MLRKLTQIKNAFLIWKRCISSKMYEKSIPKVNNNQYGIYYTEPFSGNNTDKQITQYYR